MADRNVPGAKQQVEEPEEVMLVLTPRSWVFFSLSSTSTPALGHIRLLSTLIQQRK